MRCCTCVMRAASSASTRGARLRDVVDDPGGAFVFMRAPGSVNHHDLACFTIGDAAATPPPAASRSGCTTSRGRCRRSPTSKRTASASRRPARCTVRPTTASTRACTPRTPTASSSRSCGSCRPSAWGDEEHQAIVRPLDLAARHAPASAATRVHQPLSAHRTPTDDPPRRPRRARPQRSLVSLDQLADNNYCYFLDDDAFVETDRPGFRHRIINGENLQLCFWRIAGGAGGSFLHSHEDNEQLGIIMRGALDFRIGDADDQTPHRAARRRRLPRADQHLARRLGVHRRRRVRRVLDPRRVLAAARPT